MYQLTNSQSITRLSDNAGIPADPDNNDYAAYLQWLSEGNAPEPYVAPPVDVQALIVNAVQSRLDAFAVTRNYDGILSACTYATSGIPRFAAEGQAAVNARDATWSALYAVLGEVQAGTRPVPTGFADIEPDLPALEWLA